MVLPAEHVEKQPIIGFLLDKSRAFIGPNNSSDTPWSRHCSYILSRVQIDKPTSRNYRKVHSPVGLMLAQVRTQHRKPSFGVNSETATTRRNRKHCDLGSLWLVSFLLFLMKSPISHVYYDQTTQKSSVDCYTRSGWPNTAVVSNLFELSPPLIKWQAHSPPYELQVRPDTRARFQPFFIKVLLSFNTFLVTNGHFFH